MASEIIDVYIKLTSGAVTNFPVSTSTQIRTLCEKLAEQEGVPEKCVVLKYTGKILKKHHTVGYLGVRQETILKTAIQPVKTLNLIIRKEDGSTFQVMIQNLSTILELKGKICDKENIRSRLQHLKFKGQLLSNNNDTAQDCGIDDECVIDLSTTSTNPAGNTPLAPSTTYETQEALDEETKQELLNSFAAGLSSDKKVEIVFSFDTTGSMYSYLTEVRSRLRETVTRLLRDIPNIRIGIIAHGDYCDQHSSYVIRHADITSNVDQLVDFVDNVPRSGGEGNFACYEWVLKKSQELDWTEDAAKALVILGDVVPHGVNHTDQGLNWHDELDRLCQRDIKVYGVRVRTYEPAADFYQHLAEKSGGAYIKFQHFSVITEMFLAVCYRETGDEQLDAYCEEVAMEGKMTEELTTVFKQLKETPKEPEQHNEEERAGRYVAAGWWDPSLDTGAEQRYTYDAETDVWTRYCGFQLRCQDQASTNPNYRVTLNNPSNSTNNPSNSRVKKSFRRLRKWGQGIFKKD
ncbi:uncharacterized protein [Amphiura filiformis]|uniref:uncharacterized protein n=1 Tax=Amphiura filiformis TaxID=82378 RepID=UPI003B211809